MEQLKNRLEALLRGVDHASQLSCLTPLPNIDTFYAIWRDAEEMHKGGTPSIDLLGSVFDNLGSDFQHLHVTASSMWTAWSYQASLKG